MFQPRVVMLLLLASAGVGAAITAFAQQPTTEPLPTPAPPLVVPSRPTPATGEPAPRIIIGPEEGFVPGASMVQGQGPYLSTDRMLVVVSPRGDRVWAFSANGGGWHEQSVNTSPAEPIVPVLSRDICCFYTCGKLYGFSAIRRGWSVVDVPNGIVPQLTMQGDMAVAEAGRRLYAFSSGGGSWEWFDLR
jgi:hypothetical protein